MKLKYYYLSQVMYLSFGWKKGSFEDQIDFKDIVTHKPAGKKRGRKPKVTELKEIEEDGSETEDERDDQIFPLKEVKI